MKLLPVIARGLFHLRICPFCLLEDRRVGIIKEVPPPNFEPFWDRISLKYYQCQRCEKGIKRIGK